MATPQRGEFNLAKPPLSDMIKDILGQYPDGQIFKVSCI